MTHYETLGVARDATTDEIKAAFRKLSKTTHPDIAGASNTQRFQEISNAAGVLSDKATREAYDLELRGGKSSPIYSPANAYKNRPRPGGGYYRNSNVSGFEQTLQDILRPRHLVLGVIGIFVLANVAKQFETDKDGDSQMSQPSAPYRRLSNPMVQAWMNPLTKQWEQPAPWDPTYRRLRPKLELVSRELVKSRSQSRSH
ncbi:hypothetical protein ACA910_006057 [Epithemia clementina (nom. ined.)]